MEKERFVDFVMVTRIEGMHFEPHRPEGISFSPSEFGGLRFDLMPHSPEEDASGHRMGLVCKVYNSYAATKEQELFVDSFNKGVMLRHADSISLPFKPKDEILIFENGTYIKGFSPKRYLCPTDVTNLIELAEKDLSEKVDRFIKLLRWRQFCDAPGEVLKHRSLYWRVGSGNYPHAPMEGHPSQKTTVRGMFGIHWSEKHSNDLQKLWKEKDMDEPLGHTLLREATAMALSSPRSSILMLAAALETAIKTHISNIAPDTAWLLEKTPSPPIDKILRDYIPLIHNKLGNNLDFWEKVKPSINKAQKLIELRNKIAHAANITQISNSITDDIVLVTDFLYLLDVLEGHEWAKSLLSSKLRKKLDWPDPEDGRITIVISEIL